jgi:hypothetical protein
MFVFAVFAETMCPVSAPHASRLAVAAILLAHSSTAPTSLPSCDASHALHLPTFADAYHPPSHFVKFLLPFCGEIRCILILMMITSIPWFVFCAF